MRRLLALALVVVLALPVPTYAVFGVADTGDGILAAILSENVKNTIDTSTQLAQLQQMLQTTRENYELIRSTYALGEAVVGADPARILQMARNDWLNSQPVYRDATGLAYNMTHQGLRGGSANLYFIRQQYEIYQRNSRLGNCYCNSNGISNACNTDPGCPALCSDAKRRGVLELFSKTATSDFPCLPPPTAGGAGADPNNPAAQVTAATETVIHDPELRRQLLDTPPRPDATSGVIFMEIAAHDAAAADALNRKRALAAQAESSARGMYQEATNQDPTKKPLNLGRAQVLTAQSSALAAEQLAAMREAQARQVALQHSQAAVAIQQQTKDRADVEIYALHVADLAFIAISGTAPSNPTTAPVAGAPSTTAYDTYGP